MSTAVELHSQIASIVEVLANSAVAEICKAVEDGYAVVNLEMSRSLKENECLRRRVRLLELQVSRYRAEQRLKSPQEGAVSGRVFPGVRLLHHRTGRDTPTATGSSLQSRSRFLNRSSGSQPQKTPPTDVDQDPSQEVVPVTKTEPTESEEDSDLVIVKVEGSVSVEDHNISNNNNNSSTPTARTSDTQIQSGCQTEGQESKENPTIFWKSEVERDEGGFRTPPPIEEQSPFIAKWQAHHPKLQQPSNSAYQLKNFSSRPNFNLLHATPASVSLLDSQEVCASSHHISNSLYSQEDFTPSILSLENKSNETVEAVACEGTQIASSENHPVLPRIIKQTTFSCVMCRQTFAQESQLRSHEKVHKIEKPYKCDQCGKIFAIFCHLKRHKLVHTGERPHLCVQCGKRFSTADNLKVHQSVHTGERKFKCSTCGKSYPFQSSLIRHQALHLK